jgi:uncharacterized membrane protein HdeD (DUF308 family)
MTLDSYGRLGLLLAVVGILMAVDTMTDLSFLYRLWPLLTTVLGIGFIGIYLRRARREALYVGLGVYIIGFSILALYCSLTSWTALATLWPVFIGLMGLSFVFSHLFGSARPALLLAGLLSISLSIMFYFVFGLNHRLWWTILVLAGISFIIFDQTRRTR